MKILLSSIVFLLAISVMNAQGLKVKFYNTTGHDIDSLSFQGTYIGKLSKDSSTDFINFNSISSSSYPRGKIKGIILFDANTYVHCAVEEAHHTEGVFLYDIRLRDLGRGLSLNIGNHK